MLSQRGTSRGARGQTSDRSRGRGGRGRGASTSSGESSHFVPSINSIPRGPRVLRDTSNVYRKAFQGNAIQVNHKNRFAPPPYIKKNNSLRHILAGQAIDAFEQERLANAAKREQRGQNVPTTRGRGGMLGTAKNNAGQLKQSKSHTSRSSKESSPTPSNPFTSSRSASPASLSNAAQSPFNPFAPKPNPTSPFNSTTLMNGVSSTRNPFGGLSSSPSPSVFGAPSQSSPSVFGGPSQTQASTGFGAPSQGSVTNLETSTQSSPFGAFGAPFQTANPGSFGTPSQLPSSSIFGAASRPSNPFAAKTQSTSTTKLNEQHQNSSHNTFGAPSTSSINKASHPFGYGSTTSALGIGAQSWSPSDTSDSNIEAFQSQPSGDAGSSPAVSVFGTATNPFGGTVKSNGQIGSFGASSTSTNPPINNNSVSPPPDQPSSHSFRTQSPFSNPFATSSTTNSHQVPANAFTQTTSASAVSFGNPKKTQPLPSPTSATQTGNSRAQPLTDLSAPHSQSRANTSGPLFGTSSQKPGSISNMKSSSSFAPFRSSPLNPFARSGPDPSKQSALFGKGPTSTRKPLQPPAWSPHSDPWAMKLRDHLSKEKIVRPEIPVVNAGDPKSRVALEKFFHGPLKTYRDRARKSLMRAGLIDDPEKPKKLSEAIAFKGTCDQMCPFKESLERIIEGPTAVANQEKVTSPDGSKWPDRFKMVKKHSRSAAGDEAPLPEDVRSPSVLRMTLDYLFYTILDEANDELRRVHGFLWDRTRAIRRDFIFQSSFTATEHGDYVYCLEQIARFHVVSLHQMSKPDLGASDFSEQQEREQLAKTLLSLMHEYDDCRAQSVKCENEPEFRAYYALFHAETPNVMESIQDWEAKFWEESEEVAIAVALVEAMQNVWDVKGPQKPYETADVAVNAFGNFFDIVEDSGTSYTMACFAELHFNRVRKAALKTILAAYRKQRDQTKEWTISKLNEWLRFDDEMDVISFGEAYGLHFDEGDDGELYLSFEGQESPSDPFPPYKQQYSAQIVERKRGALRLVELIAKAVYEDVSELTELSAVEGIPSTPRVNEGTGQNRRDNGESTTSIDDTSEEDGLFVRDKPVSNNSQFSAQAGLDNSGQQPGFETRQSAVSSPGSTQNLAATITRPASVFDQVKKVTNFGEDFFTRNSTPAPSASVQAAVAPPSHTTNKETAAPTTFKISPVATAPFTFSPSQPALNENKSISAPLSLGNYSITKSSSSFAFEPVSSAPTQGNVMASQAETPSNSSLTQTATKLPGSFSLAGNNPTQVSTPSFMGKTTDPVVSSTDTPTKAAAATIEAEIVPPKAAAQPVTTFTPPPVMQSERDRRFNKFVDWYTLGEDGIMDQFEQHLVENILKSAFSQFKQEESERLAREAHIEALRHADAYRLHFLYKKFGNHWHSVARRQRVRRHRAETRKLQEEMAAVSRAQKQALSESLVDDFRASTQSSRHQHRNQREQSLDSLLDTGSLPESAVSFPRSTPNDHSKPRHTRSPESARASELNRRRDDPFRRSLADDPSYMSGESRLHLLPKSLQDRPRPSGVQTDYFRLKARGIHTLPDGTPLASSVATERLRTKRSYDELRKDTLSHITQTHSKSRSMSSSQFGRSISPMPVSNNVTEQADIKAMKLRARKIVAIEKEKEDALKSSKKRHSMDPGDEELFERAKRVKASMDEGAAWYREQIQKDILETQSRSRSFGSY